MEKYDTARAFNHLSVMRGKVIAAKKACGQNAVEGLPAVENDNLSVERKNSKVLKKTAQQELSS